MMVELVEDVNEHLCQILAVDVYTAGICDGIAGGGGVGTGS